jgi:uncharacterized protein YjbK
VANEEAEDINLEHVLPQTPSKDWKIDSETAQAALRLLGNMVLLRANQNADLGNATFDEKKKVFKQSGYSITNQVADYKKWTLDEIRDRQSKMAKIAVKTWSLKFGN